jgi:hypothetical protein
MAHFNDTTTRDLVDAWPYSFQRIPDGDPLYEYLGVYATELSRIDAFIDTLYEQRFIETAQGDELEKLAAGLNVSRNTNETDEAFRYRVRLRQAQATSDGTAEDIAYLFRTAFGDAADRVEVAPDQDAPVLRCVVPQSVVNAVPLTESELERIFARAMPCGTDISITTNKVFAFASDEANAPVYAGGFGEGEWTSDN